MGQIQSTNPTFSDQITVMGQMISLPDDDNDPVKKLALNMKKDMEERNRLNNMLEMTMKKVQSLNDFVDSNETDPQTKEDKILADLQELADTLTMFNKSREQCETCETNQ